MKDYKFALYLIQQMGCYASSFPISLLVLFSYYLAILKTALFFPIVPCPLDISYSGDLELDPQLTLSVETTHKCGQLCGINVEAE